MKGEIGLDYQIDFVIEENFTFFIFIGMTWLFSKVILIRGKQSLNVQNFRKLRVLSRREGIAHNNKRLCTGN